MKIDQKKLAAVIIGLTFVAGTATDVSARTRSARAAARPNNFSTRTVNVTRDRNRNTNLNRNVNYNRNVNVNRNVNYSRNTNWNNNWRGGRAWHNGYWNNGVWHAGYWGAAAAAGAAALTAAAIGSVAYSLPAGCGAVVIGGVSYYQCGSAWYQPQYVGGSTQYVVVDPPQ